MGQENPGFNWLKSEFSTYVNFDHFQNGFVGRILNGRLLISNRLCYYESDMMASSKVLYSLRMIQCL